jgi:hypothetical protein
LPDFTKKQLEVIVAALALDKGIDLVTGGSLNRLTRKALIGTAKKLFPIAGRATVGIGKVAGRSLIGAAAPILGSPIAVGAGIGAAALATPQGQDLLEAAAERGRRDRQRFEQYKTDVAIRAEQMNPLDPQTYIDAFNERGMVSLTTPIEQQLFSKVKRKPSRYNKAVSAAMKAVKKSTRGGRKGVIKAPKSTFKAVSKAVSKVNKGAKVSSKGITGIAARAARKVLGRKKKTTKKRKGYSITVNQ